MASRSVPTLRLNASSQADLATAAALLASGGTVAFPTETVYGLGANALEESAVARIFAAKQRPAWDPLIVHIADRAMLLSVTAMTGDAGLRAERLIDAFWPGPLTLLLPRDGRVPDAVTAGRSRVGIRMPAHPVALNLIAAAGVPIAAPSANRFGRTSPTTAVHVLADLDGRIDAVLDGGSTQIGIESTVLDVEEWPMRIYRPGAISAAQIQAVAGWAEIYHPIESMLPHPASLPSPGVGLRHYAPRAQLLLCGDRDALAAACARQSASRVGVLLPDGWPSPPGAMIYSWGSLDRPETLAQRLFAGLRALDELGVDVILCPIPIGTGIAAAVRDRLEKAARTA